MHQYRLKHIDLASVEILLCGKMVEGSVDLGSVGNDEHNIADVMGVSEVLLCPYSCLEHTCIAIL